MDKIANYIGESVCNVSGKIKCRRFVKSERYFIKGWHCYSQGNKKLIVR
ncbi:MAG: hypothetical protein HDR56_05345 [Treponema sp.]|nr:hypothetical protein [Treponema sp.]